MNVLKAYLRNKRQVIDKALRRYLVSSRKFPAVIHEAMRYSVLSSGKRLRPILALACAEMCGGKQSHVIACACALEFIHTYSLIHDDLPAMDNDDYRRGRLTCHKKFNDAIAVLAGDALLSRAFEIMLEDTHIKREVIVDIARSIGTYGMIGGQVADIEIARHRMCVLNKAKTLNYIHTHKTGALLNVSLKAGAVIAGASRRQVLAVENYGKNIGLAFQIADDLLDLNTTSDETVLTYPEVYGVEKSRKKAKMLAEDAKRELKIFAGRADMLKALADYIVNRDY